MQRIELEDFTKYADNYPAEVWQALVEVAARSGRTLYLVGGTIRDFLLGRVAHDLDVTVNGPSDYCAKLFVTILGGGTVVDLSGPEDQATRVVWRERQIDFSSFRAGARTIEEDLRLRDFTINALATPLVDSVESSSPIQVIDPLHGVEDLVGGRVHRCPGAFVADPVRMLRGYRLCATLGFSLTRETREEILQHASLIEGVAAERISYELAVIFDSSRTSDTFKQMAETNLLRHLLPELYQGEGVEQPQFHHLDVLGHSFLALEMMEKLLADPERSFPGQVALIADYLENKNIRRHLKWAALMHDIGKPSTREHHEAKEGRATFYGHDEAGKTLFNNFADRLKWSKVDTELTGNLIGMHMHPFHLCNVQRKGALTKRAALKLCRRTKEDLVGLFLVAMSDSLASSGELKPEGMERELVQLFETISKVYEEDIKKVLHGPRLVTGRDLIDRFGLVPGPLFSEILGELEVARVEGTVANRAEALLWVDRYIQELKQA